MHSMQNGSGLQTATLIRSFSFVIRRSQGAECIIPAPFGRSPSGRLEIKLNPVFRGVAYILAPAAKVPRKITPRGSLFRDFVGDLLLEPCVDFILECDDVSLIELFGPVGGKAQIGFPSLSRPHGDPQILRYLFPGAEDLSFFRFILPSRHHDKKKCANMRR